VGPPNKPDLGFARPRKSVEELARLQGVIPIEKISDLTGDFWPAEEDLDDFARWLHDLRNEHRKAS
jgi:hypothetical protein